MDEAHKSNGIPAVVLPSRGYIRVFSRADILHLPRFTTYSTTSKLGNAADIRKEDAAMVFGKGFHNSNPKEESSHDLLLRSAVLRAVYLSWQSLR